MALERAATGGFGSKNCLVPKCAKMLQKGRGMHWEVVILLVVVVLQWRWSGKVCDGPHLLPPSPLEWR